ncbi:MAG: hypothetical protein AAFY43_10180 [Pseudomonadota bacterium]
MSDIGMILQRLGNTLVTGVAPKLDGDYASGHAAMSGFMAVMAGEAWDGAADRLYREIEGMRGLLAAGGVPVDTQPDSFKLQDLTAVRNVLAGELIALQARLETTDSEAAAAVNTQIWGFLLMTAAERMPTPPDFPDAPDD